MNPLPGITLRQLGQYDSAFEATIEPDGRWQVEGGSYVTRGRCNGRLSRTKRDELVTLAAKVDLNAAHPIPDADGFISEVVVGERSMRWWEPPPTDTIRALVNALACLRA